MRKSRVSINKVPSIVVLHEMLKIDKPLHELISVINLADVESYADYIEQSLTYPFYCISYLKKDLESTGDCVGKLSFLAPRKLIDVTSNCKKSNGFMLVFHPDFILKYPLAKKIKEFGFFSYSSNEALCLSEEEEQLMISIVDNIEKELKSPVDSFLQDIVVSMLELLLNYANRFYSQHFSNKKPVRNDIFAKLDGILKNFFQSDEVAEYGLPSVNCIAAELNLSPNYLSDLLRAHTGMSVKQHIQNTLIERAKELLVTTSLSVSEIAYSLGFNYSQSFNKLFKSKTGMSPLEYRSSVD